MNIPQEPRQRELQRQRRPSLLSESFRSQTHTVIETHSLDGSPRLVSYVRSAQGFEFNADIFLGRHDALSHVPPPQQQQQMMERQEPVHEIHLADDEHIFSVDS